MAVSSIVVFALALAVVLFIFKVVLKKSVKIIISLLVNALVGAIILFVLHYVGVPLELNWWSALLVGAFGIPGLIVVAIIQLLL